MDWLIEVRVGAPEVVVDAILDEVVNFGEPFGRVVRVMRSGLRMHW